jgi:Ca2+-binding RTX toxin-like protein
MQFFGTPNNDVFIGTADVDEMFGEAGHDRLEGAGGDDRLHGGLGNDQLIGGDGHDFIDDEDGGSETVDAGIGNDTIHIFHGSAADPSGPFETIAVDAGTGDDFFAYLNYRASSLTARMGDGADHVFLGGNRGAITLSLGAGADILELAQYGLPENPGIITVTDFQTGNSGDRLDWAFFLMSYLTGWYADTNPFATGHMRLVQSGAHSLLQADRDGGANNFATLITFQNTLATAFTANNLGGYPANGGPPGMTVTGTGGDDTLHGGWGADTLDGLAGNDSLYGRTGNDLYRGGDGDDRMIDDEGGSDRFQGGNGNDFALIDHWVGAANETAHFDGGAGHDTISFQNRVLNSSLVALMGDGNDVVGVGTARGAVTITLGPGADEVQLGTFLGDWLGGPITVSDFVPGAGGDVLRLHLFLTQYLVNWDGNANPFATKHLRLVQAGADAILQIDRDGGGNAFVNLVTFRNVSATAFTAHNLDRYPPNGGPVVGDLIVGTAGPDVLRGTFGGDQIDGLAGDDQLYGGKGNDRLNGGDGADFLSGGLGLDSLNGGAGDDSLIDDEGGADSLVGGDGNDWITVSRLSAGGIEGIQVDAGRGNDRLEYVNFYPDTLAATMGEGDDFVLLHSSTGITRVTLGGGADLVKIGPFIYADFRRPIELMDFAPGPAGDALDLFEFLLNNTSGWHPSRNPFATGHLQIVQSGADTLLKVDRNGGGDGLETLLIFKNVAATALTTANFGEYPPDGSPIPGKTLVGTAANDVIEGGYGPDLVDGLGGDDFLIGGWGDDIVEGGDGNDQLYGREGGDTLYGSAGNDGLIDLSDGSDSMYGGEGNDFLQIDHTDENAVEQVLIDGGAGTDHISVFAMGQGTVDVAAGDGNDTVVLWTLVTPLEVSLGAGTDQLDFNAYHSHRLGGSAAVLDFATAAGGDRFTWNLMDEYLIGEVAGINPFLTGHLQLVQSGADTLFRVDQDGGGDAYVTFFTFRNTLAQNFGPANFTRALNPVFGTALSETVIGTNAADILWGLGGHDTLDGGGGADLMDAGVGNDIYIVNNAYDQVREQAGAGVDTVRSSVSHLLYANVENLTLTGSSPLAGTGNALANIITGNASHNRLDGGGGRDVMKGGTGNDVYVVDISLDVIQEAINEGADTVESSASFVLPANVERLVLTGSAAINATGNALANQITGNGAANLIDGGAGADAMRGGAGDDIYVVDQAGDIVSESSWEGASDTVRSAITYTLPSNIEALVLTGTAAIDATGNSLFNSLTGNGAANRLNGGLGADLMKGGHGDDVYIVDHGGDVVHEAAAAGTDTVFSGLSFVLPLYVEHLALTGGAYAATGNGHANILTGTNSDNRLDGGAGADLMRGGVGSDLYIVDQAGDVVEEAAVAGIDTVQSAVAYALGVNVENLTLTGMAAINGTGNALANRLVGNAAANLLDGGAGADYLAGGPGNDTYVVDNLDDEAWEWPNGGGVDLVRASVSHTLNYEIEDLELTGVAAIDGFGNVIANRIVGNAAANRLYGDLGSDWLVGGDGSDGFFFADGFAAGIDTLADYNVADDTIFLHGAVFVGLAAGPGPIDAAVFVAGPAALDADDRIIYDPATGSISYDGDGVGGAAAALFQFAMVSPGTPLTAADFAVFG